MRLKMIGLTTLTALAAMAFIGASSASASNTALCTVDGATCLEGNRVKHIHTVDPKLFFLSSLLNVHCTGLFLGDTLAPWLAAPLHIVGVFTYSFCLDGSGNFCEAKELNGPALLEVLKESPELAKVAGKGEVLVKCGSFYHCVYNGTGLVGHALGALLAGGTGRETTTEATLNKVSGFLCPSTTKLDSAYAPLTATYITA